jgi:broad specificity phosphatase PhoE
MPLPPRPFIFVRHGQTDWNIEERMQGSSDNPLNAEGLRQAAAICQTLRADHVDCVVSSPLIRALKTAAAIAETHRKPIHIENALRERSFGAYEGQSISGIRQKLGLPPGESVSKYIDDTAEPWAQVTERALGAVGRWLAAHPDKKLVFVAHRTVLRVLAEALTGEDIRAPNATPYLFQPTPSGWSVTPL